MERIEGMISDIVFKNEDNGYTIAHLANSDNEIVIVGCMPTLSVGESIEVEGKWVNHKTYGTQFEVEKFMPITPSSLEGIYVYLSSGMIHGIGEKMAKRIVDKFGVDTLNVIQNAPERLKEVEGIGSKKIDQIVKSYEESHDLIATISFDRGQLGKNFKGGEDAQKENIETFNNIQSITIDDVKNFKG